MGKISKKEKKNYQTVSRILGILTRIGSICCWIGVGGVILAAIVVSVVAPNIKVDSDKKEISLFDKSTSYTIKDKKFEIGEGSSKVSVENNIVKVVDNDKEVISVKFSNESLTEIEKFVENDMTRILAVLPFVLVLAAILIAVYALTLGHAASVLKNIATEDTPFIKNNIERTEKAFKYMLAAIVLSFAVDLIMTIAARGIGTNYSLGMTSITSVLGVYVMIYIFKAGYQLEDGGKEEKAEKADK